MQIGIWEVTFLIILLLGVIVVSRIVTQLRAKRVCPKCGYVMRENYRKCSSCEYVFNKMKR